MITPACQWREQLFGSSTKTCHLGANQTVRYFKNLMYLILIFS
jgi:hypothetical protein